MFFFLHFSFSLLVHFLTRSFSFSPSFHPTREADRKRYIEFTSWLSIFSGFNWLHVSRICGFIRMPYRRKIRSSLFQSLSLRLVERLSFFSLSYVSDVVQFLQVIFIATTIDVNTKYVVFEGFQGTFENP